MKNINKTQRGFTLIEITIYFTIVGVVLLSVMGFAIQVMNMSEQSNNFHELQSNINFISDKISTTIKTAESVNNSESIFDNDAGALSLNMNQPSESPTTFYLLNEAVYMTEGGSPAIKLTSDYVKCTLLRFKKISYSKTPDQIVIDAEFQPIHEELVSLQQILPFHTSISLRQL
jgi:Tfp pilus assembly protein PilV